MIDQNMALQTKIWTFLHVLWLKNTHFDCYRGCETRTWLFQFYKPNTFDSKIHLQPGITTTFKGAIKGTHLQQIDQILSVRAYLNALWVVILVPNGH